VRTHDGRELVESVLTTRGGPDRPLSFDEQARKFADNTRRVCPSTVVDQLSQSCARLDTLSGMSELLRPLRQFG
jgi:hypothetical protein